MIQLVLLSLAAGFPGLKTMMQATSCSGVAAGMRQSEAGGDHAKSEQIRQAVAVAELQLEHVHGYRASVLEVMHVGMLMPWFCSTVLPHVF
jgi:hypothetical protein